ncbi:hypothetical protein F7984_17625 [Pradoshia sp. D12]|uniref:Ig-like domain-containing protein n=1 Tax=Bacillaceae TaxID=186817 RepID=UPI00112E0A92|nr:MULTISPECIES: Ig-like domain-containing protein [Bacillaceae]QFK72916.1 hypothetical protein F7984_17625 [Pradoshia sp. D12]TPF71908.1 hypothetical protein FHY44_10320 [Bacillus sp. D12]
MKNFKMIFILFLVSFLLIVGKSEASAIQQKVPEGFIGIYNPEDLHNIRNDLSGHYILMNDIDLTQIVSKDGEYYHNGAGWEPIGNEGNPFTGILDGNGFNISGLQIKDRNGYVGLFGAAKQAVFENIGIIESAINVDSTAYDNAYYGGLVGKITDSYIENAYSGVTITTKRSNIFVGGLAGHMTNSTIKNSFSYGNITANKPKMNGYLTAGTLSGIANSSSSIINSYSIGRLVIFGKVCDSTTGVLSKGNPKVVNSYYHKDHLSESSSDELSRTVEQLKEQSTYQGFDFENVWIMDEESMYPFPKLRSTQLQLSENTTDFAGGMGTAFSPYKISKPEHLQAIRGKENSFFELVNDINLSPISAYEPIGTAAVPFAGSLNGNGYTISGMNIDMIADKEITAGLFGYVAFSNIKDVKVLDSKIKISRSNVKKMVYAGGLAGVITDSKISGITVNNNISLRSRYIIYTGGIAGQISNSDLSNSGNIGDIYAESLDYESYTGGLLGTAIDSSIKKVYNSGKVKAKSNFYEACSGGVSGLLIRSQLIDAYNLGNIYAGSWSGPPSAGALSSTATSSEILRAYSIGKVEKSSLSGPRAGGLIDSVSDTDLSSSYYYNSLQNKVTGDPYFREAEELKDPSTFEGFDFNRVWKMGANDHYPFPVLVDPEFAALEKTENIKFKSLPLKQVYVEGEQLDLTGAVLEVDSNFLRTYEVQVTPEMLTRKFFPYNLGEQTLSVSYGNRSIDFTVTVIPADQSPPQVNGISNNGYYNKDVTITFNEGAAMLNGKAFKDGTVVKAAGVYTLIVTDTAGNKTTVKFTIDKTAPKITGVKNNASYNKNVKVVFNEGKASLNGKAFKSGTFIKAAGKYTLTVTDIAGNKTTVKFTIDKTAPKVTGVKNNAFYNKNVKVVFNEGKASLNGKAFKSGTFIKAAGRYTLIVTDTAGNKTTVKFTIDKTAPKISGVKNNAHYRKNVKITFNEGKATLNKVAFKSGSTVKHAKTYTLTVTDSAGNKTKVKFTIDKTAPAKPKVNTVKRTHTTVTGTAEKHSTVTVKAGKKVIGTATTNKYGKYKIKIPKQKKNKALYVSVKDKAGNVSKSTKIVVK